MNKTTKFNRKTNEQNFGKYVLEGIQMVYKVRKRTDGSYMILNTEFGDLIIYPKKDRLLFTAKNKWVNKGAEFLCNHL